eukprot:6213596-Pleurochrysis_carterae.AAC.1
MGKQEGKGHIAGAARSDFNTTAFRSGSHLLLQTLFAVRNRVSFHPLLPTLSSLRVHLQAYAGQLLVMQTDGSPPANDRLKSFYP